MNAILDRTTETQAEFEARFTKEMCEHEIGKAAGPVAFGSKRVSMRCSCEDGGGPWHWVAVRNTPELVKLHTDLEKSRASLPEVKP